MFFKAFFPVSILDCSTHLSSMYISYFSVKNGLISVLEFFNSRDFMEKQVAGFGIRLLVYGVLETSLGSAIPS